MMQKLASGALVLVCALTFGASTAAAATISIGQFLWFEDGSGFGPKLTITNSSNAPIPADPSITPGDFTDLSLLLRYFDGTEDLRLSAVSLGFGSSRDEFVESPDTLQFARLSLTFAAQNLSFLLFADDLTITFEDPFSLRQFDELGLGYDERSASASIDFTTSSPPPAPVPEPGTMILIGTGLGTLLARSRRRRIA